MPKTRVKAPRPLPDPHHVYLHASRFLVAEINLRVSAVGDQKTRDWVILPAIVLSAFASELFLKCLLILDGITPLVVHHLAELFEQLPTERQRRIEELWNRSVADNTVFEELERQLAITVPRDLKSALSDCGNAFDGMRYIYEDPAKKFYIVDFPVVSQFEIRRS